MPVLASSVEYRPMFKPPTVTFDTNTLDKAARPERHPKDPAQPDFQTVHAAIRRGLLRPFFCETIVTIEGIKGEHRAEVLGSTSLNVKSGETQFQDDGTVAISLIFETAQPARRQLHPENARRLTAALRLGFRSLHAPRIGWAKIDDPERRIYVYENDDTERQDRYGEISRAIEFRGLGFAQIKRISAELAAAAGYGGIEPPWYTSLGQANQNDRGRIAAAAREWADGDTVAAHVAYQVDYLCTGDTGKSEPSVFDSTHRAWLSREYNVRFVTISELAALLREAGNDYVRVEAAAQSQDLQPRGQALLTGETESAMNEDIKFRELVESLPKGTRVHLERAPWDAHGNKGGRFTAVVARKDASMCGIGSGDTRVEALREACEKFLAEG